VPRSPGVELGHQGVGGYAPMCVLVRTKPAGERAAEKIAIREPRPSEPDHTRNLSRRDRNLPRPRLATFPTASRGGEGVGAWLLSGSGDARQRSALTVFAPRPADARARASPVAPTTEYYSVPIVVMRGLHRLHVVHPCLPDRSRRYACTGKISVREWQDPVRTRFEVSLSAPRSRAVKERVTKKTNSVANTSPPQLRSTPR